MAKKVLKFGGWYVAYELASTALVMGAMASGLKFPGF
jgi:hypothetical protein